MVVCIFTVLSIYGLCAFIYSEFGLVHHQQFSFGKFINSLSGNKLLIGQHHCPILNIRGTKNISRWEKIDCVAHKSSQSGCIFASKTYGYNAYKRNCNKESQTIICSIKDTKFECTNKDCNNNEKVNIHIFNNETGTVTEVASWSKNDGLLSEVVSKFAKITIQNGFKFIFLSCGKNSIQLICLNDILFERKTKDVRNHNSNININIVMLDSVSRAHFYRSLHKTIATFKTLNLMDHAEVLDFKLFQALHGHSAENAHGLFNGSVFPMNATNSDRESQPVGIDHFLRYFKSKGYHTLYQDDMCWEAIWGFRQDIGGASTWIELYEKLKAADIDDTGLMLANCKFFEKYETDHIFNMAEENYICYNGQQHNAYFLQYIARHFSLFDKNEGKRSISYSALNVAHDYGGVRIQAIDRDLSQFVNSMSHLHNTLTVILADHGNTYTDFVYLDLEGRYETFHPSLFIIIPRGVQQILGDDRMSSLRSNQNKLLSMLDLHHSFKYLADTTNHDKGIFKNISPSRKCSNLPLRFPNFCVCEGWNTIVDNDTQLIGHIEFAVGKLNNIITKSSQDGMCKRLVPTLFKNVLQRKDGDHQITMFEIQTQPGNGFASKGEKMNLEITSKVSGVLPDYEMKLTSWDRVSSFGIYRECSDIADAKFRLCVCDKEVNTKLSNLTDLYYHRTSKIYDIFHGIVKEKFDVIIKDKLVVVMRTYNERKYDDDDKEIEPYLIAVTFEVINFSLVHHNKTYFVIVTFDGINNMKPLTADPCTTIVPPRKVVYMCSLKRKWSIWQAELSYKVTYNIL